MSDKPLTFADLPAEAFPLVIEYRNVAGVVVRTDTVNGPGAYDVPPLVNLYGPIWVRAIWANGRIEEVPPPL